MATSKQHSSEAALDNGAQAKWTVVIDDRLAPMPQQRLKAKDILHQSGANHESTLVRDFNTPNDVGFEPDAMVDLAEGNVFRTASGCERRRSVTSDAPPKLAFIVDDNWEVTIQPQQTGSTLRGLLAVPEGVDLLRDFESPTDRPIDDDECVGFADGPVFTTRKRNPKAVTIVVEGTPHEWSKPTISYAEVVTLFDPNYPQHPEITYSVTYKKGPDRKPEGILSPGASVKAKDGMVFNVSATGQS